MEAFTGGYVTAAQRKVYLWNHRDMKEAFTYKGHGRYWMSAWQSQIEFCRATTQGSK